MTHVTAIKISTTNRNNRNDDYYCDGNGGKGNCSIASSNNDNSNGCNGCGNDNL